MLRVVVDTNIFVSGLIGVGNPSSILDSLVNNEFKLITSYPLIDELLSVLSRPKFRHYFQHSDIEELASLIQAKAAIVSHSPGKRICRDPKDNIVIECAIAGKADCIITGDNDLLCLNTYRGISIITPKQFTDIAKN
ncbi:MAG: putative toxin-antitoxin system toxin component, PIN family [Candidatus Erginobacter occultus]|nr:putative toxin-antitoxin system toxin component, PIN family [Candidatus Erginobacter occultus]